MISPQLISPSFYENFLLPTPYTQGRALSARLVSCDAVFWAMVDWMNKAKAIGFFLLQIKN